MVSWHVSPDDKQTIFSSWWWTISNYFGTSELWKAPSLACEKCLRSRKLDLIRWLLVIWIVDPMTIVFLSLELLSLWIKRFSMCSKLLTFSPPGSLSHGPRLHLWKALSLLSFDLCILFSSPPEIMLFLFPIVVVILFINENHTLLVKHANIYHIHIFIPSFSMSIGICSFHAQMDIHLSSLILLTVIPLCLFHFHGICKMCSQKKFVRLSISVISWKIWTILVQ